MINRVLVAEANPRLRNFYDHFLEVLKSQGLPLSYESVSTRKEVFQALINNGHICFVIGNVDSSKGPEDRTYDTVDAIVQKGYDPGIIYLANDNPVLVERLKKMRVEIGMGKSNRIEGIHIYNNTRFHDLNGRAGLAHMFKELEAYLSHFRNGHK